MKRTLFTATTMLAVFALTGSVFANVYNVAPDSAGVSGHADLTASTEYAPGYAPDSWDASIPAGDNYVQWYAHWESLPQGTSVSDIDSISYYTNKPTAEDDLDWYLTIYTYADNDGNDASWYRSALTAEPMYGGNLDAPATEWNQWSTDSGTNQLLFHDHDRTNASYNGPSLADLAAGTIDWQNDYPTFYDANTSEWDYSNEEVRAISLKVGDSTDGWSYDGMLDGVRIGLTDGTVYDYNLVPEPATMGLLGLGGLGVLIRRRRR